MQEMQGMKKINEKKRETLLDGNVWESLVYANYFWGILMEGFLELSTTEDALID